MDKKRSLLDQLNYDAGLLPESFPGKSIIEIVDDCRVLVENHLGVKAYSTENILVHLRFGCIRLCGRGLEIIRMTKDQLVICGEITSVTLQRRG